MDELSVTFQSSVSGAGEFGLRESFGIIADIIIKCKLLYKMILQCIKRLIYDFVKSRLYDSNGQ